MPARRRLNFPSDDENKFCIYFPCDSQPTSPEIEGPVFDKSTERVIPVLCLSPLSERFATSVVNVNPTKTNLRQVRSFYFRINLIILSSIFIFYFYVLI